MASEKRITWKKLAFNDKGEVLMRGDYMEMSEIGQKVRKLAKEYEVHPINVMDYVLKVQEHKCWDDQIKKPFVPEYIQKYSLDVTETYLKTGIGWNYEVKQNER